MPADLNSGSFEDEVGGLCEPDEVHQAAGMVSVQLGVPVPVAMARLRAYAADMDRALAEVAWDLVDRRIRLFPLPAQRGHRTALPGSRPADKALPNVPPDKAT